ncbi:3-oxoacyl-[acyl-carrier-protein] synthase III C-terminal domain-containing protein, partial [Acinetobacter baumannii]
RFGNTSPPSIPLMMVTEHDADAPRPARETLGMVGFGVGFSWGGALLRQADPVMVPLVYHRQ